MDPSSALRELSTRASRYSINLNGEISVDQSKGPLRGSTAIVYKGTWTRGGMEVAVKTFHGAPPGDINTLKRILREVHLWSKLHHDNIVRMVGISTEFGLTISIISDWMALGNAHSYVQNKENDPRPVLMDIASGLYYLHSHSLGPVFHGDLKGSNVLVSSDRRALLGDFGLSILQESTFSMTVASPRGGSLPWMAPELLDNYNPSAEGDVWAFGMTVLELFTRLIPFHDCPHFTNVMHRLVTGRLPPRPSEESTLSRLTDSWWEICTSCWRREPLSRPSMKDLIEKVKGVMCQAGSALMPPTLPVILPGEGSLMNSDHSPQDRKRVRRPSMTMDQAPPVPPGSLMDIDCSPPQTPMAMGQALPVLQYPPQQLQGDRGGLQSMPSGTMIRPGFRPHGPRGMGGDPAMGLPMGPPMEFGSNVTSEARTVTTNDFSLALSGTDEGLMGDLTHIDGMGPVVLPNVRFCPAPRSTVMDALITPFSPTQSPWGSTSPTEGVEVEQSNDDDDEAAEALLPHVFSWFQVQRFAIIGTGTRIFVPQKIYRPYTEADQKRYIAECELKPIIYFFSSNPYEYGVALDNALRSKYRDLQDKDDPMFEGCGPSVSIRIEWPGYRPWAKQIPTNDFKTPKGPITRAKLAKNLANCVKRFIEWATTQPMETNTDLRWKVGPEHIKLEDLILVSLHHVSMGSWQPQLRLRRPLPNLPVQSSTAT